MPTPHPFALLFPTISSLLLQLIPPMDQHKHRSLTSISTSALQFLLLHLPAPCFALAFLVSVFPHRLAAASHSDVPECPSTCNKLPIQYPFGGRIGCGSPGFQLNCDGFSAHWVLPDQLELQITEINYNSHSFVVRDPAMSICNHVRPATKLNLQQFNFSSLTVASLSVAKNLHILVFDCKNLTTFPALARTSGSHVDGFIFSSPTCISYSSSCLKEGSLEISPTCFDTDSINADIDKLVRNYSCSAYTSFYNLPSTPNPSSFSLNNMGVQLQWSNVSNDSLCKRCMITNGTCGYEIEGNQSFRCFCSGGNYSYTDCFASRLFKVREYGCDSIRCGYRLKLVIALPIVALMAVLVTSFLCVIWRRKKHSMMGRSNPSFFSNDFNRELVQVLADQVGPIPTILFTYKELQQATKSFSDSRMLGDGGFGTVYEGRLRDGRKVAVKRLYHDNFRRLEQFFNEIRILSSLQHPNLVKLYGFCYEDHRDLLLVYEFVSNGTLAHHLHGDGRKGLFWETRLNIAVDTAKALAYLHSSVNPPIFHRDVKATNILLDENFHVKVADFGLSRLVPLEATHISTAPQGTPGYLDPDYHQCYQLTDKSDVYSFGVVLMEIISGKLAVDMSRERGEINLSSLAVSKIQSGALEELVDPHLEISRYPPIKHMVTRVAGLALQCLALEKDDRPSMKKVADELEKIRQFDSDGISDEMEFESINAFDCNDTITLFKQKNHLSPTSVHTMWSSSSTSSSDRSGGAV